MRAQPSFNTFFMGGFECSSHRHKNGQRLDLMAATGHDQHYERDYQRLRELGIATARTGIRWHLIEKRPNSYDWSSAAPMIRAAQKHGIQLIWDLCHYGYPDDIDIFTPEFVRRLANLARGFAHVLQNETDDIPIISPVNEISFFSWAGGDAAHLNPYTYGRGFELKAQLVRAAIEATEAFWEVLPETRIMHCDPVVHIIPHPSRPWQASTAEGYRTAQYQGWDMLCGRIWPQLGGQERYLDILGLNFYPNNEWYYEGEMIERHEADYKPFRRIIADVYERYQRPMFIAETGAEKNRRAPWFRYVCDEVEAAIQTGQPIHGICLYPILNFPGWDDNRDCQNGLWGYCADSGEREIYQPLAHELEVQQQRFSSVTIR